VSHIDYKFVVGKPMTKFSDEFSGESEKVFHKRYFLFQMGAELRENVFRRGFVFADDRLPKFLEQIGPLREVNGGEPVGQIIFQVRFDVAGEIEWDRHFAVIGPESILDRFV
jgi:hypothetical protein